LKRVGRRPGFMLLSALSAVVRKRPKNDPRRADERLAGLWDLMGTGFGEKCLCRNCGERRAEGDCELGAATALDGPVQDQSVGSRQRS
jgi:hypothetical protein